MGGLLFLTRFFSHSRGGTAVTSYLSTGPYPENPKSAHHKRDLNVSCMVCESEEFRNLWEISVV